MSTRVRVIIGVLVALVFIGVAAVWSVQRIEDDIQERADRAFVAAGYAEVEIRVDGRDIIVEQAGGVSTETVLAAVGAPGGGRRGRF